jgi:hypothetical protein
MSKGYVYVLYNPAFDKYGECYKIGQTKDIKSRLSSYSTPYPEKCEIKYITDEIVNYKEIEKKVHNILKEYRISNDREFFKCGLDKVIDCIKEVSLLDKEELDKDLSNNKNNIINKEDKSLSKLYSIMENDKSWIEKCGNSFNIGYSLADWLLENFLKDENGNFIIKCVDDYKGIFSLKHNGGILIISGKELFKKVYISSVKDKIFMFLYDKYSRDDCGETIKVLVK